MEFVNIWRLLLAFAAVILLMLAISWLAKKFGLDRKFQQRKSEGGEKLKLLDTLMLDPRRRLVVIARGNKKHLLLLGNESDKLIESYDCEGNVEESIEDIKDYA